MFCKNCGTTLPNGARFCLECGAKVEQETLVAAKCTNCNANLQVSPNSEAAICPYCGTPYIVQKAIQNFQVNHMVIHVQGVEDTNLVTLAQSALKTGKYSEAKSLANRALETNPKNIEAWLVKILVEGYDIEGDRSSDIYAYVESALEQDDSLDTQIKVYETIYEVAKIHIQEASTLLKNNIERIQRQLKERRDKNDIAAMDSGYIARTNKILNEAIEYRNLIPEALLESQPSLQTKNEELAQMYSQYYDNLNQRLKLYGSTLSTRSKQKKQENLQRILRTQIPPMLEEKTDIKHLFQRFFKG